MIYDPLTDVVEEQLIISKEMIDQLKEFRSADKFNDLPGTNTDKEKVRLSQVLNELLERLISGVLSNLSKLWVMSQFQLSLDTASAEDTEGREHFGIHLEQVMDILNIESSDGLLGFYL